MSKIALNDNTNDSTIHGICTSSGNNTSISAIQYSHNVCCVRSSSKNHVLCTDSSLGHLLLLKTSISEQPYQFRDGRDDAEDDEPNGVDASKNINSQSFRIDS